MTQSAVFEDFSASDAGVGVGIGSVNGNSAAGGDRKEAFDEGYNCGWKDGVASKEDADARIRDELSSALQEMNFTYFEARQHAVSSVKPILQAMVDAILPKLATNSLGERVAELLADMAEKIEPSATIMCAPECENLLQQLVTEHLKFTIAITPEPTFTASQAVLHLNDSQIRIDLDETIATIQASIDEFYSPEPQKEAKNA